MWLLSIHSLKISNKKNGLTFPLVVLLIHSSYPIIHWVLSVWLLHISQEQSPKCWLHFLQFAIILCLSLYDTLFYFLASLSSVMTLWPQFQRQVSSLSCGKHFSSMLPNFPCLSLWLSSCLGVWFHISILSPRLWATYYY